VQPGSPRKSDTRESHQQADVAVVIVNYNGGPLLERCVLSLEAQTLRPRRVIVVDNASADGSADSVESKHPLIQVIRCERNHGFAKANNIGIEAASDCTWIACLNPDAFAEPDWLEHLLEGARAAPQFAFFGCKLVQAEDPATLDGTGDVYHVSGLAWRRDHGRPEAEAVDEDDEIFAPCAAAALYRRDALTDVGGFDESFFCYFEDVDLAFRLRLSGHRCRYIASARVHHVGSAITGRRSDFSVYHGHRNLVWTYVKNMPSPLFWWYLPLHVALNLGSLLYFVVKGQAGPITRAKHDAVRGLRRVWNERRRVQAQKRASTAEVNRVMSKRLAAVFSRH
jgi:GT2 family glycosyltransferase